MAVINRVKLFINNDPEKDYVDFSINADITYEEHDKNIEWDLIMKFYEHDTFSPDDYIDTRRRTIDPLEMEESFEVRIKREKLDKDWFDEEVYVILELKPTEKFKSDTKRSEAVEFRA